MRTDTTLAINLAILRSRVPESGDIETKLLATMEAARRDIWITANEEDWFRAAVGAVMDHYGSDSEEWDRLARELKGMRLLNAGMEVGSLDAFVKHMDGFEPVGLQRLWRQSGGD